LGLFTLIPRDRSDFNLASAAPAAASDASDGSGLGDDSDGLDPSSTLWPPECEPGLNLEQREPMNAR